MVNTPIFESFWLVLGVYHDLKFNPSKMGDSVKIYVSTWKDLRKNLLKAATFFGGKQAWHHIVGAFMIGQMSGNNAESRNALRKQDFWLQTRHQAVIAGFSCRGVVGANNCTFHLHIAAEFSRSCTTQQGNTCDCYARTGDGTGKRHCWQQIISFAHWEMFNIKGNRLKSIMSYLYPTIDWILL